MAMATISSSIISHSLVFSEDVSEGFSFRGKGFKFQVESWRRSKGWVVKEAKGGPYPPIADEATFVQECLIQGCGRGLLLPLFLESTGMDTNRPFGTIGFTGIRDEGEIPPEVRALGGWYWDSPSNSLCIMHNPDPEQMAQFLGFI